VKIEKSRRVVEYCVRCVWTFLILHNFCLKLSHATRLQLELCQSSTKTRLHCRSWVVCLIYTVQLMQVAYDSFRQKLCSINRPMQPTTKQEFSFPIDPSIFYGKYFRKMTIKCMFTRICIKSRIKIIVRVRLRFHSCAWLTSKLYWIKNIIMQWSIKMWGMRPTWAPPLNLLYE
jgi:hypothetical protein